VKSSGAAPIEAPDCPGATIGAMKISMLGAVALLWPLAASADETFRCGKWIASSAMTVTELIQKCGEPTSRESETEDVMARNHNVGLMVKVGETTVATWTYDRGANPAMVVTIVDGHIKSIDRQK
jgi:Protein of unknown function (DUF2845)